MCVFGREREKKRWREQQREKEKESEHYRDGGGDLSQGLEAYPRFTLGSSLDIAV